MGDGFNGQCFISGQQAEEVGTRTAHYLDINSTTHGRYRITPGAIPELRKLSLQRRELILTRLKAEAKRRKSSDIPLINADRVNA